MDFECSFPKKAQFSKTVPQEHCFSTFFCDNFFIKLLDLEEKANINTPVESILSYHVDCK